MREEGGVLKNHCLPRGGTLKFCWLEFAKNFEKVFENLGGSFFDFLPTFFEFVIKIKQKSFRGKPTFFFFSPIGFQKWPLILLLIQG